MMGIFDRDSDRMVSSKDALWMDELDHDGSGGGFGGGGDRGCGRALTIFFGVVIGLFIAFLILT